MKRECRAETLSQYLDDELSQTDRQRVDEHLRVCRACREELDALRKIDEVLTAWASKPNVLPPLAGYRIHEDVQRRRRLAPLIALSKMMPAAVGSTVAAVLVLVSVNAGLLYQSQPNPQVPSYVAPPPVFRQSVKLANNRRISAMLGTVRAEQLPSNHRSQLAYN